VTFDAHPRSSLIVALDFDSLSSALKLAQKVSDLVGMFKIGNQLFASAGPEAVKQIAALGSSVFLDLKFHDIPNTVAGAVLASAAMPGVQLVNVHALGGAAMLQAAVQAVSAGVPWTRRGVADGSMMMGRLPSCTAHDVDRVLTRQGFIVTHQRGSHRYYKSPITGKIVTSVPSIQEI